MKALALEVFSKDEMGFINGGGDVTANKTIINADGSTTIITTTIKDDGTVIIDKISALTILQYVNFINISPLAELSMH